MEIFLYLISGLVSVSTEYIILQLQRWYEKKKHFEALYGEVETNLNIAESLLPLAESFSGKKKKIFGTVFDLQRFHVYCYEGFQRSGYSLSLNKESKQLLERVYELISSHNCQTDILMNEIDIGTPLPLPIMRTGEYSQRLNALIPKVKTLRDQLKTEVPYII